MKSNNQENRGDCFFACVETFIESIPKDNFYKWKTSKIFRYLKNNYILWLSDSLAYQLASDLSFINELNIELDFIPFITDSNKKILCYVLGQEDVSMSQYKTFTNEIMEWYREQEFKANVERLIVPTDIAQMLRGFGVYKGIIKQGVKRDEDKRKSNINGIVVTRSINEFYRKLYQKKV